MLYTVCVKMYKTMNMHFQKELYIISQYSKIKHCCSKAVYITFKVIFLSVYAFFCNNTMAPQGLNNEFKMVRLFFFS